MNQTVLKGRKRVLVFIAAVCLSVDLSSSCYAQERATADASQTQREEWQARVKASRERIELMRNEHRSFVAAPPNPDDIAEAASRLVLEDDTLLPGDIVSTSHGLFRFRGAPDRERRPEDFERVR